MLTCMLWILGEEELLRLFDHRTFFSMTGTWWALSVLHEPISKYSIEARHPGEGLQQMEGSVREAGGYTGNEDGGTTQESTS